MRGVKQLPKFVDHRGILCVAEKGREFSFELGGVSVLKNPRIDYIVESYSMIIVVKGSAIVSTNDKKISVESDQYIELSDGIISIDKYSIAMILSEQPQKSLPNLDIEKVKSLFDKSVSRVFYIKDVPTSKKRGGHAHRFCHQVLIAVEGHYTISSFDGVTETDKILETSSEFVHIPPGVWAEEFDFSKDGICLVLTSHKYDVEGYINNKSELHH